MMQNKRRIIILPIVATLLLIPLIAMQFTTEVNWDLMDFIVAAILLLAVGFTIDYAIRKTAKNNYRFVILTAIIILFILIWAELAVGIFGTPFAGS